MGNYFFNPSQNKWCLLIINSCFRVETIDGSAVEGEDYEPVNEILTFEPREREKEVNKYFNASFTLDNSYGVAGVRYKSKVTSRGSVQHFFM